MPKDLRRFLSVAVLIVYDAALTAMLLGALSFVHWAIGLAPVSEEFKALFLKVHETVWMGSYVLLAVKGMLRIWKAY